MVRLLVLVLLSCLRFCWASVGTVSTKGFLTVTDQTYKSSQLGSFPVMGEYSQYSEAPNDKPFEARCINQCLVDDKCLTSSVIYKTAEKTMTCRWTGASFCAGNISLANLGPGTQVKTWEKKVPVLDTRSCFEICIDINNGNCTACSRVNCRGKTCSDCPATCDQWRRYHNYPEGSVTVGFRPRVLWPAGSLGAFQAGIACSGDWAVLYGRLWNTTSRNFTQLVYQQYISTYYNDTSRNLLMIELITEADQVYRAVYQGFSISSTSLTVLKYLSNSTVYQEGGSSDPGDGFQAPVYNAPFISRNDSLCGSFWDIANPMFKSTLTASLYPSGYNESSFDSCASGTYFFGPSYYENPSSSSFPGVPANHTGMAWSTLPGIRIKGVYLKVKNL